MNPWKQTVLDLLRNVIRFSIWSCFAFVAVMAGIFLVCFSYQFFRHAWTWCCRVLFGSNW